MSPLARLCPDCGNVMIRRDLHHCPASVAKRVAANHRKNARPEARGVYNTSRWRRLRSRILATATECEVCGGPPTDGDPLTAGHVLPFTGPDDPLAWDWTNLRAEHRSCNSREAATRQAHG